MGRARATLAGAVWLMVVWGVGWAVPGTGKVGLRLVERAGVERRNEPVTTGIPLPKSALLDPGEVRLLADGREVPAQFRAAGLWRPGRSIRWLLVDLQASLGPGEEKHYTLEFGPGVSTRIKPPQPLRIREEDDCYLVDTGEATFRISRRTFSIFEEVRLADGTVVVPRPGGRRRRGALITGLRPTVTRAIPARSNTGRSHLIYVKNLKGTGTDHYTLRFLTNTTYEVVGARSGRVGVGAYRRDFVSTDRAIAIPADAWLAYHRPRRGDVYTFTTVPAGASALSEGLFETRILERGPLRCVIEVKGSFGPTSAPVMEFTCRYHFHAGSGRVRLLFTLENNDFGGRTSTGNARNADIGGVNCVFFDEMSLLLPTTLLGERGGRGCVRLEVHDEALGRDFTFTTAGAPLEIYQDSNGGEHWDRYRNPRCHPRPNSYVSFRGWRAFREGRRVGEGLRAVPALVLVGRGASLVVAVQDFWRNHPKALGVEGDGAVRVGLFPGRYAADFPFRSGEHKTHEVLFDFRRGAVEEGTGRALARAFDRPLRLEPAPQWFATTRALGDIHPYDPENYPAYEVRNLSAIGIWPKGLPKRLRRSIFTQRERYAFYGWMDYGDVPIDFENPSGQWGMKYDLDYQMLVQWARTLRPEWWRLFVAADKHTRDIDIHHQPHYPWIHYVKGGVWAHSLHNEPGNKNPHRNYNHFTKDLCFGARGTAALYYLTGDWKAREACLEIAENALARYMSPQRDPGPPEKNNRMGVRGDACTLNRLLEGYLLTGDGRFLKHARWEVHSCAFDGRPAKHKPTSLWSSVFYMMALARYVELFPDDAAARRCLLAHLEMLLKSVRPGKGIYYTVTPQPDGSVVGKGTCSHYNVMAADALALGYRLTGRREYIEAARICFDYGVKNACWKNGPPTYYHIHSANGATHGNLFMVVDSALRSKRTSPKP